MVNITHKSDTLREAIATAILQVSSQDTIDAIQNRLVPKGDVFEFSRAAGLLAVKKTSDVIPDCHPLPVEYAAIRHRVEGLNVHVIVEVHTIYKTGVEVEAMHGAAVTALTMYDMLKPIDKLVEISSIKLLSKKGGKTDYNAGENASLRVAVVVCSDSIAAGRNKDISGKRIIEKLEKYSLVAEKYAVIRDDVEDIQQQAKSLCSEGFDMVLFTGGTGLAARDVTPEAIQPLLTREVRGISETLRHYGQQRMPYAMLGRSVAGFIENMLVITMPGSVKGVTETMDALFPQVLHAFKVKDGLRHE